MPLQSLQSSEWKETGKGQAWEHMWGEVEGMESVLGWEWWRREGDGEGVGQGPEVGELL